jgi:hypothetical protein
MKARTLVCAAFVAAAAGAPGLVAQDSLAPAPRTSHTWTRPVVHYGKWLSAASALGFTLLAAHEHDTANRSWQQLLDLCRQDNTACQSGADGRYAAYQAELLYQQTLYYDRRARHRMIVGQISALTSAALFILDLRHDSGSPPNIPFHGLRLSAEPAGDGARVEVQIPF